MRIIIRTSIWAIWARRLASLAVPLLVLPVVLYRQRLIETDAFHIAETVALGVALAGLLTALVALARLWQTGDRGWGRAIPALFVSLFCLLPFGWLALEVERYPAVTDVATIERQFLPLRLDAATEAMRPPVPLAAEHLGVEFPDARSRAYGLGPDRVYAVALGLIAQRGWTVVGQRQPSGLFGEGLINARVTHLLGWRDEVVLRIAMRPGGTGVDMRSVSLDALHDLGANGRRIEEFLNALDAGVAAALRDMQVTTDPEEEDEDGEDAGADGVETELSEEPEAA